MVNKTGCITVWFSRLATLVFTIKKDKNDYISSHLVVSFPHRPLFHELLVHFPRVHFFELSLIDAFKMWDNFYYLSSSLLLPCHISLEFVFSPLNYCFFSSESLFTICITDFCSGGCFNHMNCRDHVIARHSIELCVTR